MNKSRIHIENMTIRMPRSVKNDPRRVASDVGREVLTQLAEAFHGQTGTRRIDAVSANVSSDKLNASGIRQIANGVAMNAVKSASRRNTK